MKMQNGPSLFKLTGRLKVEKLCAHYFSRPLDVASSARENFCIAPMYHTQKNAQTSNCTYFVKAVLPARPREAVGAKPLSARLGVNRNETLTSLVVNHHPVVTDCIAIKEMMRIEGSRHPNPQKKATGRVIEAPYF